MIGQLMASSFRCVDPVCDLPVAVFRMCHRNNSLSSSGSGTLFLSYGHKSRIRRPYLSAIQTHPWRYVFRAYQLFNFLSTRSPGRLFDPSDATSPRIPAIGRCIDHLPDATSKNFAGNPIAYPKIYTQRAFVNKRQRSP